MSSAIIQPQVDALQIVQLPIRTIWAFVIAGLEDDVQPGALHAFRALGDGVLVDKTKILAGEKALKGSTKEIITRLKIMIGLPGSGIAKAFLQDHHMVSAFLLIVACQPCFTVDETGKLLYSLMERRGVLNNVPATPLLVSDVIRAVAGYGSRLGDQHPSRLFSEVGTKVRKAYNPSEHPSELLECSNLESLANTLSLMFEALQDADVKQVQLDCCRSGIWLATFFLWLFSDSTECRVHGTRIYPESGSVNPRLSINIVRPEDACIRSWRKQSSLGTLIDESLSKDGIKRSHSHYPLEDANMYIQNAYKLDVPALKAVGQLASALVQVGCEAGHLVNRDRSTSRKLKDICSTFFLNYYPKIIQQFGWPASDMVVDTSVQSQFVEAIQSHIMQMNAGQQPVPQPDDFEFLKDQLDLCYQDYLDNQTGSVFLEEFSESLIIIEPAVYLATEALLFAFCQNDKDNGLVVFSKAVFRPPETHRSVTNANILRELLFTPEGCSFAKFRAEAMQAMLPGSPDITSHDLAVAGDGFVAYAAALRSVEDYATEEREASVIRVVPGTLKSTRDTSLTGISTQEEITGTVERLTEVTRDSLPPSRCVGMVRYPINAFSANNAFDGIRDSAARNPNQVAVEHWIDNMKKPRMRTLYLTTYLHVKIDSSQTAYKEQISQPTIYRVPTSWKQSIEAIAFAEHVKNCDVTRMQERSLALQWKEKGFFTPEQMQWCPVGGHAASNTRYISMTHASESLRFFEAGYLAYQQRKLFVRHRLPLMQCIKVALERCGDDPGWAIIA